MIWHLHLCLMADSMAHHSFGVDAWRQNNVQPWKMKLMNTPPPRKDAKVWCWNMIYGFWLRFNWRIKSGCHDFLAFSSRFEAANGRPHQILLEGMIDSQWKIFRVLVAGKWMIPRIQQFTQKLWTRCADDKELYNVKRNHCRFGLQSPLCTLRVCTMGWL